MTSARLNATSTLASGSGMRTPSCTMRTRFGGPPRRPISDAPRHLGELGRTVADDDGLGMREHVVDGGHHEPRDVRNLVQDVVAVRAVQAGEAHAAVVHAQLVALADEALGELHHRALA